MSQQELLEVAELMSKTFDVLEKSRKNGTSPFDPEHNGKYIRELCNYFHISGGAFVIGLPSKSKFILVLPESESAPKVEYLLSLSKVPTKAGSLGYTIKKYNAWYRHIFNRFREEEGFSSDESVMRHSISKVLEQNHVHVSSKDMYGALVCWKALWTGLHMLGEHATFEQLQEFHPPKAEAIKLFTGGPNLESSFFTEKAIRRLDIDSDSGDLWHQIRDDWDRIGVDAAQDFVSMSKIDLMPRQDTEAITDTELFGIIETICSAEPEHTLQYLVGRLYENFTFPIPAYYYYIGAEMKLKEHLTIPIFGSRAAQVNSELEEGNQRPVVISCVLSLNPAHEELSETKRRSLSQILQLISLALIDDVFIPELVSTDSAALRRRRNRTLIATKATIADAAPNVFVLGTFDARVSFLSQQTRALALVDALFNGLDAGPESDIIVVGGGVAGVTAASACLLYMNMRFENIESQETNVGQVLLFESEGKVLSAHEHAKYRFVHPHIIDWPTAGSTERAARVPVLGWTAGSAHAVSEEICQAFEEMRQVFEADDHVGPKLEVHAERHVQEISAADGRTMVHYNDHFSSTASIVILCTGYGSDQSDEWKRMTSSYWGSERATPTNGRLLVSGVGDGALIDLARALFPGASGVTGHKSLINEFVDKPEYSRMANLIREVDARLQHKKIPLYYEEYFKSIDRYVNEANLTPQIEKQFLALNKLEVTLVHKRPGIFKPDSDVVHRLIVFLLIYQKKIKTCYWPDVGMRPEDVVHCTEQMPCSDSCLDEPCGKYRVALPLKGSLSRKRDVQFDAIVVRHGPNPSLHLNSVRGMEGVSEQLERHRNLDVVDVLDPQVSKFYADAYLKLVANRLG